MAQHGPYLRRTQEGFAHFCPACRELHVINVDRARPNGARWKFDGNAMAPGFAPSVRITAGDEAGRRDFECCHYTLTRGTLTYHSDSTHAFAGREMPLPLLPAVYRDH